MAAGYEKLVVWQKADELAFNVYKATEKFPVREMYGLTSQIRRAAVSIPTNIVEGTGRHGKNEARHFVSIALGSLAETEYLLGFSLRLGYLDKDAFNTLNALRGEVGALLWGFHRSF